MIQFLEQRDSFPSAAHVAAAHGSGIGGFRGKLFVILPFGLPTDTVFRSRVESQPTVAGTVNEFSAGHCNLLIGHHVHGGNRADGIVHRFRTVDKIVINDRQILFPVTKRLHHIRPAGFCLEVATDNFLRDTTLPGVELPG